MVLLWEYVSLSSMLFIFNGFCRLGHVLFSSIHNSNPRSGSVLKQGLDLKFNTFTIFMVTNMYVQDWANFRIPTIQPLARVQGSLQGSVYSLHKCTNPLGPSAVPSVMKYCPLSTVFKPASEHSLDNFWSSESCSKFLLTFLQQVSPSRFIGSRVSSRTFSKNFHRFLRIICFKLPRSHGIFGYLPAHIRCCSIDTELICRNNRA